MNIPKALKPAAKGLAHVATAAKQNSNWIVASISVLGVMATAWAFTDATIKAVKVCQEKQVHGKKEVLKTVWKLYIPGVGIVLFTTLAILGNAHSNARKLAIVTGAWAAQKADLKAIKAKAKEMLGDGKVNKIEDETEREKLKTQPLPTPNEIQATGHGDQLFRFGWTGQYFRANPDYIDLMFREANEEARDGLDELLMVNNITDKFNLPPTDSGYARYDFTTLREQGIEAVKADIRTLEWVNITGKPEMVSIVKLDPEPTELF